MTKNYVTFLFPGSLFPEETVKEIVFGMPEIPKGCFAYYLWDREEVVLDGETLYGKPKNITGRYYFGKELSLDEVKRLYPDAKTLHFNMQANKYKTVVRTRCGNFQPLEEKDTIVSET